MVEFLDANGNLIILTRDKNRSYQVMPSFKEMIDPDKELFLRVEWKSFVEDQNDGFWEKGMTSVPMVA